MLVHGLVWFFNSVRTDCQCGSLLHTASCRRDFDRRYPSIHKCIGFNLESAPISGFYLVHLKESWELLLDLMVAQENQFRLGLLAQQRLPEFKQLLRHPVHRENKTANQVLRIVLLQCSHEFQETEVLKRRKACPSAIEEKVDPISVGIDSPCSLDHTDEISCNPLRFPTLSLGNVPSTAGSVAPVQPADVQVSVCIKILPVFVLDIVDTFIVSPPEVLQQALGCLLNVHRRLAATQPSQDEGFPTNHLFTCPHMQTMRQHVHS
mmetsp:Transcript_15197/g.51244  ORF Transcript_15197/g.51244 Transcript_15197/m.51244 type:complete len:264 (-) Transcript_15197:709-1500(-)